MKIIQALLMLAFFAISSNAQNQAILGEDTVRVSEHVWAIMGFPNIGIVVGRDATLVVDTGLGPRNGATAAKVAKRFAPPNKLYLTTTHFHPEHVAMISGRSYSPMQNFRRRMRPSTKSGFSISAEA